MIDSAVLIPVYRSQIGELHIVMILRKPGGVHGGQIDNDALDAAPLERANDALNKCLAIDRQERLGPAHSARFAGR